MYSNEKGNEDESCGRGAIMKLRNIIHFSLDFIIRRFGMNIMLIIVCGITAYMTDMLLTNYYQQGYDYKLVKGTYGVDVNKLNYIDFMKSGSGDIDKYEQIIEQIDKVNGVTGAGTFTTSRMYLKETDKLVDFVAVDAECISLGNAKISDEQMEQVSRTFEKGYLPVFVGNNLKEQYKVGEVYTDKSDDKLPPLYIVGYLPKDAKWMKQADPFRWTEVSTVSLSDELLIIRDDIRYLENKVIYGSTGYIYYMTEDGADEGAIRSQINDIVEQQGYFVSIYNIGDIMKDKEQSSLLYNDTNFIATLLIMIIAVLSVSASTIVMIILYKKNYGILFACGASLREISIMMAINNVIIVILPSIAVYVYRAYELKAMQVGEMWRQALTYAHGQCVPLMQGLVSFVIIVITILIPLYMIHKMNPVELINHVD